MNFSQALATKLEDIKRPPVMPVGNYTWMVTKHPELDAFESQKNGITYDRVTFMLSCVAPSDDVDPDDLAEYGNVQGQVQRKVFMFANGDDNKANYDRTMFDLRRFLGHLGVDESLALGEGLAASVNQQCLGELRHRPDPTNPEIIYAEIGRTAEL